jgi:serine phosphatase RsbU (regulator of sigma subunit)
VPAHGSKQVTLFERSSICPALGLLPETEYAETKIEMGTGDEIVLYTDGIIEAAMGEEGFSEERLITFLDEHRREQISEMADALLLSVREFTQSQNLDDHVCLIGLRIV